MSDSDDPLTVVVTRVIKPGCEEAFERTMREFLDVAWTFPGHLGMHMLRPAENHEENGEYTIIVRFDSLASRKVFRSSEVFKECMVRMDAQSVGPPIVRELKGIDGWAALAGENVNPPRWKMAVTVWIGVTGLSQLFAWMFAPFMTGWPRHVQMVATSTLTVIALTWFVLPRLMRAMRSWYFPRRKR